MKPPPFDYHRPVTSAAAIELLASLDNTKLLAGGQSLMPMMNFRYVLPEHVVDLNHCDDLSGIRLDDDAIVIGSMTRQRDIERSALIVSRLPLLNDALYWVGHIQTRNRGTIGGSLAHMDPAAELPAALAAYDASIEVRGPRGARDVSLDDWSLGYMTPDLAPDELIASIRIPLPAEGHAHAFYEVARRHGDFAQAGAAVVAERVDARLGNVRVALTGVDTGPVRLTRTEQMLNGQTASAELFADAAQCASEVPGIADVHADEVYRRRIAVVVTRRALEEALPL